MDSRLRLAEKRLAGTLKCSTCIYFDSGYSVCRMYPPQPGRNNMKEMHCADWPTVIPSEDWCAEHTTEVDIEMEAKSLHDQLRGMHHTPLEQ